MGCGSSKPSAAGQGKQVETAHKSASSPQGNKSGRNIASGKSKVTASTSGASVSHAAANAAAHSTATAGAASAAASGKKVAPSPSSSSGGKGPSPTSSGGTKSVAASQKSHSSASSRPVSPPEKPRKEENNGYVVRPAGDEPLAGHSDYTKIREINSGASGFVQLARERETGQEVAIKFVPRGSPYLHRAAEREILNHRLLAGHAHIVQFREVFLTEGYLGIVMEYVNGGDMADLVDTWNSRNRRRRTPGTPIAPGSTQCLPEDQARRLFQQLMVAVDFLHHLGIANRDIKLENALLGGDPDSKEVQLKLCDFGYSKDELSESLCKTLCGTPEYIAPEVLIDNRYQLQRGCTTTLQGKISDIWSAGVLLYVLLTGVFPFWRKEDEKLDSMTRLNRMFPRIVKAEYDLPAHVSQPCRDLLARMLSVDTKRRLSVAGILRHPWFRTELSPSLLSMNSDLLDLPTASRIRCKQSEAEIRNLIHIAAGSVKTSSTRSNSGTQQAALTATRGSSSAGTQTNGSSSLGGTPSGTPSATPGHSGPLSASAIQSSASGGGRSSTGARPPVAPMKTTASAARPMPHGGGGSGDIYQTSDSIVGLVDLVDEVMDTDAAGTPVKTSAAPAPVRAKGSPRSPSSALPIPGTGSPGPLQGSAPLFALDAARG